MLVHETVQPVSEWSFRASHFVRTSLSTRTIGCARVPDLAFATNLDFAAGPVHEKSRQR